MAKNEISSFSGDHRFLSNFYPVRVKYDGLFYPSTEHAYQAAKTVDLGSRRRIREAKTAGLAKSLGRKVRLREHWEGMKFDVMLELLRQKFAHPELATLLLETEGAELIEENTWGDREWGTVNGVGKNHLGRLLMQVRKELIEKRQGSSKNT